MKCQSLFYGKNKKNIVNLSSAELAQIPVKVKLVQFCYRTNMMMVLCLYKLVSNVMYLQKILVFY